MQYLRKQPVPAMYNAPLKDFEAQLARADAQVQSALAPNTGEVNELTEGLKTDEADADWKKKSIYD